MSENNPAIPSPDMIQGMIGTLMSNPDLLKSIAGALGGIDSKAEKQEDEVSEAVENKSEESANEPTLPTASIPPELISKLPLILSLLSGSDSPPKSQGEKNREALLCALKPYLSPSRAEAIEKIIKLSRLGDIFGSI